MSKEVENASAALNRSMHIKDALALRLEACAKVKLQPAKEGESNGEAWKLISDIIDYVNYFNALPEHSTQVFGIPLDKVTIINEFKDFIYPSAVRVDILDRRGRNLLALDRNKTVHETTYNYAEFMNLQVKFRNYLRKDANTDVTPLATAMKPLNLFDVISKSSCGCKCIPSAEPFYPIPLKPEVATTLFEEGLYFIIDDSIIIDELINNWLL